MCISEIGGPVCNSVSFPVSCFKHVPFLHAGHRCDRPATDEPIRRVDQPVPHRGSPSVSTGFNSWKILGQSLAMPSVRALSGLVRATGGRPRVKSIRPYSMPEGCLPRVRNGGLTPAAQRLQPASQFGGTGILPVIFRQARCLSLGGRRAVRSTTMAGKRLQKMSGPLNKIKGRL